MGVNNIMKDKIESNSNKVTISYTPLIWENNVTPLNAKNLNHMTQGIVQAMNQCAYLDQKIDTVNDNLSILRSEFETHTANSESEFSKIKSSIENIEGSIDDIEISVGTNTGDISEIKDSMSEVLSNMEEFDSRLSNVDCFNIVFAPETGSLLIEKYKEQITE